MREQIYVAWRNPYDTSWQPVGLLSIDEDSIYHFVYTKGALKSNFVDFPRMKRGKQYISTELFPLFTNRIISDRRPDYKNYLKWLGLDGRDYSKLRMLVITEGIKATDNLEFFQCPIPNERNEYEVVFVLHGLRYFPKNVIKRVNELREGERLFLNPDPQNMYDPDAIMLRTEDPIHSIGYCPRYMSPDFKTLLSKNNASDVKLYVKKVNREAPLNLRLICKIVAPWPNDFRPCDRDEFKPLIINGGELRSDKNDETLKVSVRVSSKSVEDFSSEVLHNNINDDSKSQKVGSIASSRDEYKKGGKATMKNYAYGRRKEQKVAKSLRGKGASVKVSAGSRGAADLRVSFSPARKWNVQVKSSRGSSPASPSRKDIGRLKQSASRSGATPVVAKVTTKGTVYKSARTGRTLRP